MQSLYTKGPSNVPPTLTNASPSFKKHVWLALLGLLLFAVLYFILIFWFGKLAYYSFTGGTNFWHYILGGGYAFLCLFLVKSLFFLTKRQGDVERNYVTKEEEPVLFDFLYSLADEAGAPRPHKVFLTDRVNASVSYDLSILNLIIPSKKNLEIGLGLVNILSLGEFKAVLAHEFGHFAQRSMLLGRYVYVAQQVAVRIIGHRDFFDNFLNFISSIDIRISWIGWILSILVWAVRSLIETCFSVVALAERALSREMEFQADLVAVSLTGSDALIHALKRLQVADEAYANALDTVNALLNKKKAVKNMYPLQSNYIKKMGWVLNEPSYGESPVVPSEKPETNRIFSERAYNPPQMWSTHPADKDREENAKHIYIPADIDNRPAKELLANAEAYELKLTADLIKTAKVETELIESQDAVDFMNTEDFSWSFLHPKYNSAYLTRYTFIESDQSSDFYERAIPENEIGSVIENLYNEEMGDTLEQLKEINEEMQALEIRRNEPLTVEKRAIWHRGERVKRTNIPEILESLKGEEANLRTQLKEHDILCRCSAHEAAKKLGKGWDAYLQQLSSVIHYAEHAMTDMDDASGKFYTVVNIALADGKVSSSELDAILRAGNDFYKTIKAPFKDSVKLSLDEALNSKFSEGSYEKSYEEFKFPWPEKNNLDSWVNSAGGWAAAAKKSLLQLRNAALERLLDIEEKINSAFLAGQQIPDMAPQGIVMLNEYKRLLPGSERKIDRKLTFWDRFMSGEGLLGSTAKFAVSFLLIGGALFLGSFTQKGELYVYNGLGIPVEVNIDGTRTSLDPHSYKTMSVSFGTDYTVKTTTQDGELIETFNESVGSPGNTYIYSVAAAAIFVEYPIYYGYDGAGGDTYLGAKRWFKNGADYILKDPPSQITLSSGSRGTRKDALTAYSDVDPYDIMNIIEDETEFFNMVAAHTEWDMPNNAQELNWLTIASQLDNSKAILEKRTKHYGKDVATLRALMEQADENEKSALCNSFNTSYNSDTENADFYYLKTRCIEDEAQKDNAFVSGYERWKDHSWLAFASAYTYAQREQWKEAYKAYQVASENVSLQEVIAIDAARVRKMIFIAPNEDGTSEIPITSSDLQFYEALATGSVDYQDENPNNAYYLMSQGKLDEALSFTNDYLDFQPYVLRQLAVSVGASEEIKEAAKKLNDEEGMSGNTIWYALAFAELNKLDNSFFKTYLTDNDVDTTDFFDFMNAVKRGDYNRAEQIIDKQSIAIKGHYYAVGVILRANNVPKEWRIIANKLLFVNERPYLGSIQ